MPLAPILLFSIHWMPPPDTASWRWNLPSWCRAAVERAESQKRVALSDRLNPYYLQGDFDGDGKLDLAVLVRGSESGKAGILVVFQGRSESVLLGAGVELGSGGDDFSWMDVWSVYPKGPLERGAGESGPPKLRGDALAVEKSEAASAIVYWDGKAFRWYQQGD
jgi:hypothetical protein